MINPKIIKQGFGIECPYCSGIRTERLEGGVVWECLDCGAAFNQETYVVRTTQDIDNFDRRNNHGS